MIYTVKDVCRKTGVTRKTLFYYDRIGLLSPAMRTGKQKIRVYTEEEIEALLVIRTFQKAGFHLSEIRNILHCKTSDQSECFDRVIARLETEKQEIEDTISFCRKLKEEYNHDQTELPKLSGGD